MTDTSANDRQSSNGVEAGSGPAESNGETPPADERTEDGSESRRSADALTETHDGPTRLWGDDEEPHVLLLLKPNRNRRLLAEFLERDATVTETTDADALTDDVDLCLVDRTQLGRHRATLVARRETLDPVVLPIVLVDSGGPPLDETGWMVVDEVIQTPISKPVLRARLRNLLARRRQSVRLTTREAELETALTELRVRDRAMAEAPIGVTIAGPRADGTPLVYVNDTFCDLTGYDRADVLGRNCRFLQGPRSDDETVQRLTRALDAAEPVSVDIVNYTGDGEQFWNKVDIAPVHDDAGEVTHFVGFQTDITSRKLHEQRVDVLNRFLRHNLRNELNIIDGYRDALTRDVGVDRETALDRIGESITRLVGLSEEASHIEQVFSGRPAEADIKPIAAVLDVIRNRLTERYPDVTVHVEAPSYQTHVRARTLALGCVDYLSTLLDTHGEAETDRTVSVVATVEEGIVDIALTDDDGGLVESEWRVVEAGSETPLEHTDQLGLWVLRWVTTTNGGELVRSPSGTLHARFPVRQPSCSASDGDANGTEDDAN